MRKIRNMRIAAFPLVMVLICTNAMAQVGAQADLEALIKVARADGEVLFYTGATENIAKRTSEAFTAKYGVRANFNRTAGVVTIQRFANEAESGAFAADFFFTSTGAQEFSVEALKKGWVESVASAGIPVVASGEFPTRFLRGSIAIVQIAPWLISYNTDKLKGAEIPRDWVDLLHPRFKGQILLPEPKSSDAYSDFWGLLLDRMGESFLIKLREQNPRFYSSGVPSTNGLAAGEGSVAVPAVGGQVSAVKAKGAPIDITQPPLTTGVEMTMTLTHRAKARRPNAARLFAHFVMSPEGNKIFNADPGSLSVYDVSGLPKSYESPKPGATARRALLSSLLGAP